MSAFPRLKLTYFGLGRADPVRLALYIGQVPFVDERLTRDQFNARKSLLPFGRLPVLEIDGVTVAETNVALRYAGRLSGLYPVNAPLAALQIDEILHALEELNEQLMPAVTQHGPSQREEILRDVGNRKVVERCAGALEARLEVMQETPFFKVAGERIFIHHLALHNWAEFLHSGFLSPMIPTTVLDTFPLINRIIASVDAHPKVQEWRSFSHEQPKLKLTYLPSTSRAEAIRLVLTLGGIPFEDEQLSHAEFNERKGSSPFHQLPVLEITTETGEPCSSSNRAKNIVTVAQSFAILRYTGTLAGLYPTIDMLEAARIDELLAVIDEGHNAPLFSESFEEHDAARQRTMRLELASGVIPCMLGRLEKRVAGWGGRFAAGGDAMTVADVAIYALVGLFRGNGMPGVPASVVDPYANLLRISASVGKHPVVAAWDKGHHVNSSNGNKKRPLPADESS
jgi:glutathione S-transferase